MSQLSQLVLENKCPDCLYLEMNCRPRLTSSNSDPHKVNIFLTINFNEQRERLPGGYVSFGLTSGELRLTLTHGLIPYQHRHLAGRLALNIDKERQLQSSTDIEMQRQASVGISFKADTAKDISTSAAMKKKSALSQSDKFVVTSCQVTSKGLPELPAWVFSVQTNDPVLKGLLANTKLATMNVSSPKWKIQARFEVPSLRHVKITESDGPWLRNAPASKRMALELGLAKLLLRHKLSPYLSQTEIGYE